MRANLLMRLLLSIAGVTACVVTSVTSLPVMADDMPQYNPPAVSGAPTRRVGGGTRGAGDVNPPILALLAPKSVGLTLQAQPLLYWSLSQSVDKAVELAIHYADPMTYGFDPILKTELKSVAVGVQVLNLADYGIELDADVEYEVSLALILEPEKRLNDVITSATILRVSPETVKSLDTQTALTPNLLAENGIWYDALANLSAQIAQQPEQQAQLRQQRAHLLEQVGLSVRPQAQVDIVVLPETAS